jgi:hypothetical protein
MTICMEKNKFKYTNREALWVQMLIQQEAMYKRIIFFQLKISTIWINPMIQSSMINSNNPNTSKTQVKY